MRPGRRWTAACAILPATALAQVVPTSTETGQSPLDESFGAGEALKDTKFDVQLRAYDFDRDNFDGSENEALAIGGHAGFKTGYFRERFAFGATGYTSQRIYGPEDKDGTGLLAPGQEGYTVVGELFGELLLSEGTRLTVGRRGINTPFLNRNDSRMSPNTFEAIALQGLYGGGEDDVEWRAGAGYFDEIKQRNSEEFVSMATAAGAPAGVERGVYVAGANYKQGDVSIGAIDYYSDDIINIFYTEAKYALQLGKDRRLQFALQYSDQRSVGANLLQAADFSSAQIGGKVEIGLGGALFTAAYTTASGDSDLRSPWGSYPGFTKVQVFDFNRDGEDAWMLRAAYNFKSVKGLAAYALWVHGSDPQDPAQFAMNEYDLNLEWSPDGPLKGLMLRLRFAHVTQDDPDNTDEDELRLMVFYDPPAL